MKKCHEIDYQIIGDDMQMVEIELDPQETVIAEAGMMNYMESDISFLTKMGDGSNPSEGFMSKVFSAGKRMLTGESLFMTHFTNTGYDKRKVAFAAPYPGKIIPFEMEKYGNKIICQKDSFLCASLGTKIDIHFNRKIGSGFFGGEGFILQAIEGDDMAFAHAGGCIIKKELNNETILVDTGCVVAFTDSIDFDIQSAGGLKSMLFGGEGIFLSKLSGTGTIWLQSLPFSRLANNIIAHAPTMGGKRQGEGSILGGIGDLLDGDN